MMICSYSSTAALLFVATSASAFVHGPPHLHKLGLPHPPRSFSPRAATTRVAAPLMALPSRFKTLPDMELPDDKIITAIDDLKGRATVADVASGAGVSLEQARAGLVLVPALLAGADRTALEVDSDGELLYTFPRNVRAALKSKSRSFR